MTKRVIDKRVNSILLYAGEVLFQFVQSHNFVCKECLQNFTK